MFLATTLKFRCFLISSLLSFAPTNFFPGAIARPKINADPELRKLHGQEVNKQIHKHSKTYRKKYKINVDLITQNHL